jgi:hypothetical protein
MQVLKSRKIKQNGESIRLEVKLLNGSDLILELVGT